jgi:hypothetical protein
MALIREIRVETSSYLTAHTTSRSSQTAEMVVGWKRAASEGIFAGIVPRFRSPVTPEFSQVDFWPHVSAAGNSVPGGRGSTADTVRQPENIGSLWGQKRRLSSVRIIAD